MAAKVAGIKGVVLDESKGGKWRTDPSTGAKYVKFEYTWDGGKADIAIVPKEAYMHKIATTAVARRMPKQIIDWITKIKSDAYEQVVAEREHGKGSRQYSEAKAAYENAKDDGNRVVEHYFNLLQARNWAKPPKTIQKPLDMTAVDRRIATMPTWLQPIMRDAIARLGDSAGGLVHRVLQRAQFMDDISADVLASIDEANRLAHEKRQQLASQHGEAYRRYIKEKDYEAAHRTVAEIADEVSSAVGGLAVVPPELKGAGRAIEKAVEYSGDESRPAFDRLRDIVRGTIVVADNMAAVWDALERVLKSAESRGVKVKIEHTKKRRHVTLPKNRFKEPDDGYRDVIVSLDLGDGRTGELQIHVPEMLIAKEFGVGHELYELARSMELAADTESLTQAQIIVAAASSSLYGDAFDYFRARASSTSSMNSSLEILSPSLKSNRGGYGDGGSVSNRKVPPPPSATGIGTSTSSGESQTKYSVNSGSKDSGKNAGLTAANRASSTASDAPGGSGLEAQSKNDSVGSGTAETSTQSISETPPPDNTDVVDIGPDTGAAQATPPASNVPSPAPAKPGGNLSPEKRARLEELKARIKGKLGDDPTQQRRFSTQSIERPGQPAADERKSFDPSLLADGAEMAALYFEDGIKGFGRFAKTLVSDLGPQIRPYIKAFYQAARYMPGVDPAGMRSASDVHELSDSDMDAAILIGEYFDDPVAWMIEFTTSMRPRR